MCARIPRMHMPLLQLLPLTCATEQSSLPPALHGENMTPHPCLIQLVPSHPIPWLRTLLLPARPQEQQLRQQ